MPDEPKGRTIGDLEEEIRKLRMDLEEAQGRRVKELELRLEKLEKLLAPAAAEEEYEEDCDW